MGEVYRAADRTLGRDVALKILPTALASDPARIERFQREAAPSPPSTTLTSSRSIRSKKREASTF
jgi:serine/threonine protein kinase